MTVNLQSWDPVLSVLADGRPRSSQAILAAIPPDEGFDQYVVDVSLRRLLREGTITASFSDGQPVYQFGAQP